MIQKKYFFLILFLALFSLTITAQTTNITIKGKVIDSKTKAPLAFVNIIYGANKGVITALDGQFKITTVKDKLPLSLKLSYIGYNDTTIIVKHSTQNIIIKMQPKSFILKEVVILPTENPAHRIIKLAIKNKTINDPQKHLNSFYYKSYNKMYFTGIKKDKIISKGDTLFYIDTTQTDTSKIAHFLNKQHLFLIETVSERYFEKPDKSYEKVLASRVSGFTIPTFIVLATQFQSFSCYNSQINLLDKKYLSPLAENSWKKYLFLILDTSYTQEGDTVFIIKFRPRKGKNFDALKGVLYISTPDYAVRNIIAEPVEQGEFYIKIIQNYKKFSGQWMPYQLNSQMIFNGIELNDNYVMAGIDKTYLFDVIINSKPDTLKPKFGTLDVSPKAFKHSEEKIKNYRVIPLTHQDSLTYHIIDSLGKAEHLERKYTLIKYLLTGKIPIGFVNINLNKLLNYNLYEKFRLGLGLETNERLLNNFSIAGYYAYSFGIHKQNYGGNISLFTQTKNLSLNIGYLNDVREMGKYNFYKYHPPLSSTESYRFFYLKNMDYHTSYYTNINFATTHLSGQLNISQNQQTNHIGYKFITYNNTQLSSFKYNTIGIQIRYAPGEKIMKTIDGVFNLPSKYPVLYLNATKGIKINNEGLEFQKYELMIKKDFDLNLYGIFRTTITAGYTKDNIPLSLLYDLRGSNYKDHLFVGNTFQTMNICSFYASKFIAGHFYYDLKKLIINTPHFAPNFVLAYSIAYGQMDNKLNHTGINFNVPTKVYSETGLIINDILSGGFQGLGVGIFYKLPPYASTNYKKNFTFKLSLILKLD